MIRISQDLKKRLGRKLVGVGLSSTLVFSTVFAGNTDWIAESRIIAKETEYKVEIEDSQVDAGNYGLASNIQDGTILHCFDWKYNDIKAELPNIAAAGFTSVQTSPAQKGDGDVWYWLYQPQTFSIAQNALGNKADLQALCDEAEKYGIKVVVDVVANHTRSIGDDGLGADCFHNDGDAWYTDRYGITHGKIGMPDLNSESSTVQNKVKGYIEELKSVGVDGIRWDAAKHISLPSEGCQFWPVVTSVGLYNYGEILVGPLENGGEGLMKEYTNHMSVTDSKYGQSIREAFEHGGVPSSIGNWSERGVSKDKLVYWAESHDTYSNDGEYGEQTAYTDQNIMDRAYAIVAGQGKATSLYFSRPHETRKQSIKAGVKGSTHFTSKEVAAVNHLHNNCVGEKDYYVNGGSAAAVCRESGAVIVKGSGSGHVEISNGGGTTAPGTYTDEVSGSTWTVTADKISGDVGQSGIAVIYKDSGNGGNQGGEVDATTTPAKTTTPGGNISIGANTIVATKPSGWDDMYIYAYQSGATATKLTGEWPGTKMSAGSDGKYTYTMDSSVTNAKVIFASGASGSQDPQDSPGQDCGFDYVGGKAYTYDGGSWSELSVSIATEKPQKTPEKTQTPEKTKTPSKTEKPKDTEEPEETQAPSGEVNIKVNKFDGTSFTEETMDVKITLSGVTNGTYCVDNGPEKTFKSGDTVTIGQGKIADSTVTLEVSAGTGTKKVTKTFEYEKVFDPETAIVRSSAISRIQSLFEVVADAAEVNGTPGSSYYATNPNGNVGTRKTITSASDFTEDMIIAQGVANDDPGAFRGTHEAPKFDPYAMYGAWDDENLYIGIQYTNVIDVVDPAQQAPQTGRGKPNGADADIPQMLVFDTRSGDYTDGTTNDTTQKTAWDTNVKFGGDAKVDKVFLYSPKDGIINQAFFPVTNGLVDYDSVVKSGYNMPPIPGVETTWEDGFFGSSIYGIKGTGYTGYTPADLESDSGDWVDFLSEGHSKEHDTFCIVKLPLSLLGVTASDIENNGIGVMAIATYGSSGIGSLPADMTMLDVADEAYSKDDSTSQEKEDEDLVTVGLAQLGKSGGAVNSPTKKPAETKTPDNTVAPTKTETPTKTNKPAESKKYTVNFGADYSSPQYDNRKLTLKAIPYNGEGDYTYEFSIDGELVQSASSKATYNWSGEAGKHTIKVVVEDESGKKVTSEKEYEIEAKSGGNTQETESPRETIKPNETKKPDNTKTPEKTEAPTKTNTPIKTDTPNNTNKPTITKTPTETKKPDNTQTPNDPDNNNNGNNTGNGNTGNNDTDIKIGLAVSKVTKSPQKAGNVVIFAISVQSGGTAPYFYRLTAENSKGQMKTLYAKNISKTTNVKWTPTKADTYKIHASVVDGAGNYSTRTVNYKVTNPIKVSTFKANKKTVKKGKSVKFTFKATSIGKVQYRIKVQKVGSKKITIVGKYSTKKTKTWKATSKGKYYIYLQIKDAKGNTTTKKLSKPIKVK